MAKMAQVLFICVLCAGFCGACLAEFVFHDVAALGIRGKAFPANATESPYDRLPRAARGVVRAAVWDLSTNSAGMFVEFTSNSSVLVLNYTLRYSTIGMWHFPPTGVAGMDLYSWDSSLAAWRWVHTTHTVVYPVSVNHWDLPADGVVRRYRLHLPNYNAPVSAKVGVAPTAVLLPAPAPRAKRVVWYGTSICQGGVASRPGQMYTHILTRRLQDYEFFNFGFSGNGVMELSVAKFLVQIPDVSVFIVDCNPNMNATGIRARTVPLVQFIRRSHPNTPIVLAEGSTYGESWILEAVSTEQTAKRVALKQAFKELVAAGDHNIHYVSGDQLFALVNSTDTPTVGGTHPTDLGMYALASVYETVIPAILDGSRPVEPVEELHSPRGVANQQTLSHPQPHPREAYYGAEQVQAGVRWIDFESLGVHGRAFPSQARKGYYNRLPASAQGVVTAAVWELSQMSTGLYLSFETNSSAIALNYTLAHNAQGMWHWCPSGTSGMDLRRFDENSQTWRFVADFERYDTSSKHVAGTLVAGLPKGVGRYLLYLPLRNTVLSAFIGVDATATLTAVPSPFAGPSTLPIVWYGTSIDQGGVASRASMTYTNQLSRLLKREVLNFGFAGNGLMSLHVAKYLVQINASVFVIDCNPNMNAQLISERAVPLVKYLRSAHPTTPIVMAEGTRYGDLWFLPSVHKDQLAKRAALQEAYRQLVDQGDQNLHYVKGDQLFDDYTGPIVNPTVGGTHPSDLGHYSISTFYAKLLPKIMAQQ